LRSKDIIMMSWRGTMRIKIEDLPERYRKQVLEQIGNRTTVRPANLEQGVVDDVARPYEAKKINAPVSIHIHSVRQKFTDSDGVCAKWIIDGIVAAGVLPDDSPSEVARTSYSQELAKRKNHCNDREDN